LKINTLEKVKVSVKTEVSIRPETIKDPYAEKPEKVIPKKPLFLIKNSTKKGWMQNHQKTLTFSPNSQYTAFNKSKSECSKGHIHNIAISTNKNPTKRRK